MCVLAVRGELCSASCHTAVGIAQQGVGSALPRRPLSARGSNGGLLRQVGRLWTSLADFYIRQGLYEHARDVYEEGLQTVTTVRDFSLIFDTLTQFEETLIAHRLATADEDEEEELPADDDGADALLRDDVNDIDLRRGPARPMLCRELLVRHSMRVGRSAMHAQEVQQGCAPAWRNIVASVPDSCPHTTGWRGWST